MWSDDDDDDDLELFAKETSLRLRFPLALLAVILLIGATGYYVIGEGQNSFLDCLYMAFITVSTIGFGEVVDVSSSPMGKIFTMLTALMGIGVVTFILSTITGFVVEGNLNRKWARRRMKREIKELAGHAIVCGCGSVGQYAFSELHATGRPFVVVDTDEAKLEGLSNRYPGLLFVLGDATENDVLAEAGIERATGLFATTQDDNLNLVITLTAKQLNPECRVIAHSRLIKNCDKMRRVGADSVVSSEHIGGLRMASEMIRPAVVSFLDEMLRDKEGSLRFEEVRVGAAWVGKRISDINVGDAGESLLVAVRDGEKTHFNPARDFEIPSDATLVYMSTAEGHRALTAELN